MARKTRDCRVGHKFSIVFIILCYRSNIILIYSQGCILDIPSSKFNHSNCEGGNWGGFLNNNCCEVSFDQYLHGLGQLANRTGRIYLNSTEQKDCLKLTSVESDALGCGMEKLTSGAGGCSDYTVPDVMNKLGNKMKSLGDDCWLLGLNNEPGGSCNACLARWNEMGGSLNDSDESTDAESYVCRFSVLISLISKMIGNEEWVRAALKCLGGNPIDVGADEQGSKTTAKFLPKEVLWILVGGLGGIAAIVLIAIVILLRKSHKKNTTKAKMESVDVVFEEKSNSLLIPIKEVYMATNNLSQSNFIGQGLAGKVYKGILSNGQQVAIKHIINDEYVETFVREVRSLSHVKHPNLVALLGYCEDGDECFLVYELCQYGTLSEWLFGKDKVLSWIKRLEIAIDSARALWFLHTYPGGCIVHRDIKPTNILLGDNYQAKLSDFGLSKVMAIDQSYVTSEVRGTFGYVDPEYQTNSRVNPSSDVYSFGIVLLQIISGKRVLNLNLKKPMPLNKMATSLAKDGHMTRFADPKLNNDYPMEAFDLIFKLALSCTGLKRQRPSMEQVVARLENALDISSRPSSPPNMAYY